MPRTLVLHIGHYKTGTTALQVFCMNHRRFLAKNGIDYPDVWMHNAKHSAFAFGILKAAGVTGPLMYDYADETPTRQMWRDLYRYIDEAGYDTTLLSSEEFMRLGQFPRAVEILRQVLEDRPADLDIRAIAYLRDPAAHMRSWYNQLIKMNFPVPEFNAAIGSAIEDIHFDYRRALEPWLDILGPDRLSVRPYGRDPADPALLHKDFFDCLGVALPPKLARIERDPNPRFDERAIELVRLMQNMGFPRASINAVRHQALSYLEKQDTVLAEAQGGDSGAVQDRIRAGIDWVAGLPQGALPAGTLDDAMPDLLSEEERIRNLLIGFVFSEFIQLRQKVQNANMPELTRRIEALEARLGAADGDS